MEAMTAELQQVVVQLLLVADETDSEQMLQLLVSAFLCLQSTSAHEKINIYFTVIQILST